MSQRRAMKILLLDEDQKFAKKLNARLRSQGIDLHWRRSLFELGSVGKLGGYDLLLIEPLIGPVNGLEIAEYVDAFFPGLPVVLVNDRTLPVGLSHWPKSVVGSISKNKDIDEVIAMIKQHDVGRTTPLGLSLRTAGRNSVAEVIGDIPTNLERAS